jgi:hypothetical protein
MRTGRGIKDLLQADWTRHKGLTSGGLDESVTASAEDESQRAADWTQGRIQQAIPKLEK